MTIKIKKALPLLVVAFAFILSACGSGGSSGSSGTQVSSLSPNGNQDDDKTGDLNEEDDGGKELTLTPDENPDDGERADDLDTDSPYVGVVSAPDFIVSRSEGSVRITDETEEKIQTDSEEDAENSSDELEDTEDESDESGNSGESVNEPNENSMDDSQDEEPDVKNLNAGEKNSAYSLNLIEADVSKINNSFGMHYDDRDPQNYSDNPSEYPGFRLWKGKAIVYVKETDDESADENIDEPVDQIGDEPVDQIGDEPAIPVEDTTIEKDVDKVSDVQKIKVGIFGLQTLGENQSIDNQPLIILDQNGGLAVGGPRFEGVPTGTHTYKGYNLFRYTYNAKGETGELQSGPFLMEVDFTTGIGKLDSRTRSTLQSIEDGTMKGTHLRGVLNVDAANGKFQSRSLNLTEQIVNGANEYSDVQDAGKLPTSMYGEFHGQNGVGVTGIYLHDTETGKQFHGGIVGSSDPSIIVNEKGLSTDFD